MSQVNVRYEPNPVPDDPQALIQFLSDELYRISAALNEIGFQNLGGAHAPFALNTTPVTLANYPRQIGRVDAAAGSIIIPKDGLYNVKAWIEGGMTSPNNNNQYALNLLVDGSPELLAVNDVAHNSTDRIALSATASYLFAAGQVCQLQMVASASMGTCTLENSNFDVARIN